MITQDQLDFEVSKEDHVIQPIPRRLRGKRWGIPEDPFMATANKEDRPF